LVVGLGCYVVGLGSWFAHLVQNDKGGNALHLKLL